MSVSLCDIYDIIYNYLLFILSSLLQYLHMLLIKINYFIKIIDSNRSLSSTNSNFNQDFFSTTAMYAFVILFIFAINSEEVKLFIFGLVIITNFYQVR